MAAAASARGTTAPGSAAETSSLFDQNANLRLLYSVSRELTAILDRDALLSCIATQVKTLVDYSLFAVMLWNENTRQLENVFAVHYGEPIPVRFCVPLFKGITGHAAGERRAVRVDDVRLDPRYVEMPNSAMVRSELVVPLLLQDRLIGVIDLEGCAPGAFTEENERLLTILSSYIAIALENSRLYAESREHEQRLQSDLDTARQVQQQLLPQKIEAIPGLDLSANYLPARDLGGDFYDVMPYGSGRAALILGDVSGKGTAAALYGSLAIGTLRENTRSAEHGPAQILSLLNRRLCASHMSPGFVALLFAVYEEKTNHLAIGNGGTPRPILMRGGELTEIPIDGMPLGLFMETGYDTHSLKLEPNDIVIIASDGILESMNPQEELFGFERLVEVMKQFRGEVAGAKRATSAEIACAILDATDKFSGKPSEPHDDRTLLVLRMTADGSSEASEWEPGHRSA